MIELLNTKINQVVIISRKLLIKVRVCLDLFLLINLSAEGLVEVHPLARVESDLELKVLVGDPILLWAPDSLHDSL